MTKKIGHPVQPQIILFWQNFKIHQIEETQGGFVERLTLAKPGVGLELPFGLAWVRVC